MTKLKPWYQVVFPREDLRRGEPLDAAEFAVHLDEVALGRGPEVYRAPQHFFERTYLTANLIDFAAEVARRLAGQTVGANAVFNMSTQFGGGKTHALALLYHLASNGPHAEHWPGVDRIVRRADLSQMPQAGVAVFVGQRFDPRPAQDDAPPRRTPWGEIAWQLAGQPGYDLLADFDERGEAPGGHTIGRLFDLVGRPVLVLLDEVINFMSRNRRSGLAGQMYNFLFNLVEEARSRAGVVVAIALPKSAEEMTADDEQDYRTLNHMLDRLSRSIILSTETDAAEIIRRRLFTWTADKGNGDGRIKLEGEALAACKAYAASLAEHRRLLPAWFDVDNALAEFKATYPFHPALISVFERKWQSLPSFQRTRGVLRLLALWVAHAYDEGVNQRRSAGDPLIELGAAPFEDPIFRQDVFAQLGERALETAVTTDIAGHHSAHAVRLDQQAGGLLKQLQLHRKVAAAIFFESNGGMSQTRTLASIPEIRLAVSRPDMDIGNVETALEALAPPDGACYYLDAVQDRYWFSMRPNLTRLVADRKQAIESQVDGKLREVIQDIFGSANGVQPIFFPTASEKIPNQPRLTVVVLPPEQSLAVDTTLPLVERMTRDYGEGSRVFKNALIWVVADTDSAMREAARKLLAWESIDQEQAALQLSESQRQQVPANRSRAHSVLKETIWRAYCKVVLLDPDGRPDILDLGQYHSSSAASLTQLVVRELQNRDEVLTHLSPQFLVRNWPPALTEWSTKAVRDAFFAAPSFPRLLNDDVVRSAIVIGVTNGAFGYMWRSPDGRRSDLQFNTHFMAQVELSDETVIVPAALAEQIQRNPDLARLEITPATPQVSPGEQLHFAVQGYDDQGNPVQVDELHWSAAAGIAEADGLYTAPHQEGSDRVTVRAGAITGQAEIRVHASQTPAPTPTPEPSAPTQPARTRLTWQGAIPPLQWTNFYLKVMTKLAHATVRLRVTLEVTDPAGLSPQKVEEVRAGLRELGLPDDVGA